MSETLPADTCGWHCGDAVVGHRHFAVVIRENGKLLGRLCPDGTTSTRNIYAAVLSKATAERVAAEINERPLLPGLTAKVAAF